MSLGYRATAKLAVKRATLKLEHPVVPKYSISNAPIARCYHAGKNVRYVLAVAA